eukprot:TRINITY_DN1544_c0_g2_i1.p1 TRINITY_DN1544_c0_g2~~TRINITY_DN1544_c0_g2_i1.p1  ORF type:complete len:610 (+),score=133.66 TRINITY_DN1544_c0_g2_i1:111-1940(+)
MPRPMHSLPLLWLLVVLCALLFSSAPAHAKKTTKEVKPGGAFRRLVDAMKAGDMPDARELIESDPVQRASAYAGEPFDVLSESTRNGEWEGLPIRSVLTVRWEQHELDTPDVALFLEKKLWARRFSPLLVKGCDRVQAWPALGMSAGALAEALEGEKGEGFADATSKSESGVHFLPRREETHFWRSRALRHLPGSSDPFNKLPLHVEGPAHASDVLSDSPPLAFSAEVGPQHPLRTLMGNTDWLKVVSARREDAMTLMPEEGAIERVRSEKDGDHTQYLLEVVGGDTGAVGALAYDWNIGLHLQLIGRTTFVIYDPSALWAAHLWPSSSDGAAHAQPSSPALSSSARFPFANYLKSKIAYKVTLEPGDMLLIPEAFFYMTHEESKAVRVVQSMRDEQARARDQVFQALAESLQIVQQLMKERLATEGTWSSEDEHEMVPFCRMLHLLYAIVDALWPGPDPAYRYGWFDHDCAHDTISRLKISTSRIARTWHGLADQSSSKVLMFLELLSRSQLHPAYEKVSRSEASYSLAQCDDVVTYGTPLISGVVHFMHFPQLIARNHLDQVMAELVPIAASSFYPGPKLDGVLMLREWTNAVRSNVLAAEDLAASL